MVISERSRHDLYEAAKRGLGPEAAETLMELVPPVGWAEVATKQDLQRLEAATRQDIQNLQEAIKKDLAILEHTMRGEMEKLRGDLMAQMVVQTRTMVFSTRLTKPRKPSSETSLSCEGNCRCNGR